MADWHVPRLLTVMQMCRLSVQRSLRCAWGIHCKNVHLFYKHIPLTLTSKSNYVLTPTGDLVRSPAERFQPPGSPEGTMSCSVVHSPTHRSCSCIYTTEVGFQSSSLIRVLLGKQYICKLLRNSSTVKTKTTVNFNLTLIILYTSLVPRACMFVACSTKFAQRTWAHSSHDTCRSIHPNHFTENQCRHRMCRHGILRWKRLPKITVTVHVQA